MALSINRMIELLKEQGKNVLPFPTHPGGNDSDAWALFDLQYEFVVKQIVTQFENLSPPIKIRFLTQEFVQDAQDLLDDEPAPKPKGPRP